MSSDTADSKSTPQPVGERRQTAAVDVRVLDPETGLPWTQFMDGRKVQRYLHELGIDVALQTLSHKRRAQNAGLKWWFHGQRPITTKDEVDRFIAEDLLSAVSPLVGKTRRPAKPRALRQPGRPGKHTP